MFKDTYEGQTHYVGDNCNPPHPPMENKNTWQERFDELFPTLNFSGEPNEESDRLTGCFTKDTATLPIEIKSFLHQEIDLAVKRREGELREEYKKMVGRKSVYLLTKSKEYVEGYKAGYKNNEDDTLTLLTHKGRD